MIKLNSGGVRQLYLSDILNNEDRVVRAVRRTCREWREIFGVLINRAVKVKITLVLNICCCMQQKYVSER